MQIHPDPSLLTKKWIGLGIYTAVLLAAGGLLQLLIPLRDTVTHAEVAAVLWPIVLGVVLVSLIFAVPVILLWVKNLSYVIEDERVIIFKGILTKVEQSIPYRAITDFLVARSVVDRWLGIGTIRIQTAGQSTSPNGYEGTLAGLAEWKALHEALRARLRDVHPGLTVADVDEPGASPDLLLLRDIRDELQAIRAVLERP